MVLADSILRDMWLKAYIFKPVSFSQLDVVLVKREELNRLYLPPQRLLGELLVSELLLCVVKGLVLSLLCVNIVAECTQE